MSESVLCVLCKIPGISCICKHNKWCVSSNNKQQTLQQQTPQKQTPQKQTPQKQTPQKQTLQQQTPQKQTLQQQTLDESIKTILEEVTLLPNDRKLKESIIYSFDDKETAVSFTEKIGSKGTEFKSMTKNSNGGYQNKAVQIFTPEIKTKKTVVKYFDHNSYSAEEDIITYGPPKFYVYLTMDQHKILVGQFNGPKYTEQQQKFKKLLEKEEKSAEELNSAFDKRMISTTPPNLNWFQSLFGFDEFDFKKIPIQKQFRLNGNKITSNHNNRSFDIGNFSTPTLNELRELIKKMRPSYEEQFTFENKVVYDILGLHANSPYATFQAASQFNCLEMVHPNVPPEAGITNYIKDLTQGPACALACAAGTLYRNYFHKLGNQVGQTSKLQVNTLGEVEKYLKEETDSSYWSIKNGYVFSDRDNLSKLDRIIKVPSERKKLMGLIQIGRHANVGVTFASRTGISFTEPKTPVKVTQVYASALSCAYSGIEIELWTNFAQLVLDGMYEATLLCGYINTIENRNRNVYLTFLGGGAFGNKLEWIASAIGRAMGIAHKLKLGINVVICHYKELNEVLKELINKAFITHILYPTLSSIEAITSTIYNGTKTIIYNFNDITIAAKFVSELFLMGYKSKIGDYEKSVSQVILNGKIVSAVYLTQEEHDIIKVCDNSNYQRKLGEFEQSIAKNKYLKYAENSSGIFQPSLDKDERHLYLKYDHFSVGKDDPKLDISLKKKYLKYAENSSGISQPSLDKDERHLYLKYKHKYLQLKKLLL